eukprot:CAMPEP_0197023196 /NCGR_PEP_ID=MMETSP1384-20130603/3975_1 /TAXON_ID=29189 /ORGANISM="Ammonia sp." /LENGTH=350 /DNA_ID=CAMNT_0042451387 /DNA_START=54 /DNA_END=1106 /DNA_ORIENTATION=+
MNRTISSKSPSPTPSSSSTCPPVVKKSAKSNTAHILQKHGLTNAKKMGHSLQGSVWSAQDAKHNQYVVKVTSKALHEASMIRLNGKLYAVQEDIKKEAEIMQYVTMRADAPRSIAKFVHFFETDKNYYLVMEHGGTSLFEFVCKAHKLIQSNNLDIAEWHRCVKVIFRQLIESVRYLHSLNVSHFDLSLENTVINDVAISEDPQTKRIRFHLDSIQIKVIDFGLAEYFGHDQKHEDERSFLSTKYVGKEVYKSPEVVSKRTAFNAKANDIFCCGVCLFMMVVGSAPWRKASVHEASFVEIINHKLINLIHGWDRLNYVTVEVVNLMSRILRYEQDRLSVDAILKHPWMNK